MSADLLPIVRVQLKRPRTVPTKLDAVLGGMLNIRDSKPGEAPGGPLFKMEEYEQELLLSRFFTPEDKDRAACEAALPDAGLTREAMETLSSALISESLSCPMVTGVRSGFCPIPEVVVVRYVRLLGLEAPLDPRAAFLIGVNLTGEERLLARSLARRPVWRETGREGLLPACLDSLAARLGVSAVMLDFLTHFIHTYRCCTLADLRRGLASLVESYRIDSEHPTYNPRLETSQAESIRSHYCDESVRRFRVAMAREMLAVLDP
ncbi:MAG: hypothetical protein HQM02_01040 [Magnetococcales bacterium]|nr:hypothetical protein [Magnetococcales bacterium]